MRQREERDREQEGEGEGETAKGLAVFLVTRLNRYSLLPNTSETMFIYICRESGGQRERQRAGESERERENASDRTRAQ